MRGGKGGRHRNGATSLWPRSAVNNIERLRKLEIYNEDDQPERVWM
jgi:hypothetical protein